MKKIKNIALKVLDYLADHPKQVKAFLVGAASLFGLTIAEQHMDIVEKILAVLGVLF